MSEIHTPVELFALSDIKHLNGANMTEREVLAAAVQFKKLNSKSQVIRGVGVTESGTLLFKYQVEGVEGLYMVPSGSWKLKPEKEISTQGMKALGYLYYALAKDPSISQGAA